MKLDVKRGGAVWLDPDIFDKDKMWARPESAQAAFASMKTMVDKYCPMLGYSMDWENAPKVRSVAYIVSDIESKIGGPLTRTDIAALEAYALPAGVVVSLEVENQDNGDAFRVTAPPDATVLDVFVLLHGLFKEAKIHPQETLMIDLDKMTSGLNNEETMAFTDRGVFQMPATLSPTFVKWHFSGGR